MSETALSEDARGDAAESVDGESSRELHAGAPHAGTGTFWTCGEGIHSLDDPTPFGQENALQKLGKPPFEKTTRSRFRLLGYLATMYEHVSQDVARAANIELPGLTVEVPQKRHKEADVGEAESES